ncbi:hypothetical protein [Phreatobacter oligotrophus]|uniref:hypothetical protein n=1 Tax=Phreatobacter oligotrophus TaxID=1122261 RepID=UPI002354FD60|nr:hypothetical protein [Phreatobacter oligotrophus]MBX9990175.1 hypothetical protein [Phreatobacter oligotrophus]
MALWLLSFNGPQSIQPMLSIKPKGLPMTMRAPLLSVGLPTSVVLCMDLQKSIRLSGRYPETSS